ncbi:MAG: M2 family metallopeptidase, partial [Pseudomonadota bacterium]
MRFSLATSAIALTIAVASCTAPKETLAETTPVATETVTEDTTVTDAKAFMARAETELSDMSDEASLVFWNQATNITDETNAAAAEVGARATKLAVSLANESKKFNI